MLIKTSIDGAGCMVPGALDSNGKFFPLDSCKQTVIATDAVSGSPSIIEAEDSAGNRWRQTIVYVGGVWSATGFWVKQ